MLFLRLRKGTNIWRLIVEICSTLLGDILSEEGTLIQALDMGCSTFLGDSMLVFIGNIMFGSCSRWFIEADLCVSEKRDAIFGVGSLDR